MSLASLQPPRAACTPSSRGRQGLRVSARLAASPSHTAPGNSVRAAPAPLVLAAVAAVLTASPSMAAEAPELFANKCAGCHMNGGNVLAVGATLFPEDLKRNGVDSSEAIYRIVYSGKGKMPGFGKDCAPKGACTFGPRLSDEEVAGLAAYVQERAAAGWKQ
ncbi:hypothetical protein GPECTOR_4g956 [Gonium pectorale]|uniref:Cytochrome c-553 n=1 Tax=Gonium pectorale TaxID=33097 RepID=A0A150GYL4_GONPE|nr:hypothetical protein GPECTOR_4g956 [Gonium pectorale]|eukprot:KXZ54884.1 hypothetical protein GPECTOR_4g956 [Gonium pectorale]